MTDPKKKETGPLLFQICALIICDCNGEKKTVKIGQWKSKIPQKHKWSSSFFRGGRTEEHRPPLLLQREHN